MIVTHVKAMQTNLCGKSNPDLIRLSDVRDSLPLTAVFAQPVIWSLGVITISRDRKVGLYRLFPLNNLIII